MGDFSDEWGGFDFDGALEDAQRTKRDRLRVRRVVCPYCQSVASLTDSAVIYGRSYGPIYLCQPCEAYVGVHKGTHIPLGTLADRETREARKAAHATFDRLWRETRHSRAHAYRMLKERLKRSREVHIGESSAEECQEIITASRELLREALQEAE